MKRSKRIFSTFLLIGFSISIFACNVFADSSNDTKSPDYSDISAGYGTMWFTIDAKAEKGGTISPGGNLMAVRASSRTYSISASIGYAIQDVLVDGLSVGPVTTYTFEDITQSHTIVAKFRKLDEAPIPSLAYSDVDQGAWYFVYIKYVTDEKIMDGVSDTKFSPDSYITRAMLLQSLYNMAGYPEVSAKSTFEDVSEASPYYRAICWGVEKGIISGYNAAAFGPDDYITREQMATILYRYCDKPSVNVQSDLILGVFKDYNKLSEWAKEPMTWAVNDVLFSGTGDGKLSPTGTTTRAQAAVLLYKLNQR